MDEDTDVRFARNLGEGIIAHPTPIIRARVQGERTRIEQQDAQVRGLAPRETLPGNEVGRRWGSSIGSSARRTRGSPR
jgi:hypothetical protein